MATGPLRETLSTELLYFYLYEDLCISQPIGRTIQTNYSTLPFLIQSKPNSNPNLRRTIQNVLTSLVEWIFWYSVSSEYKTTQTDTHTHKQSSHPLPPSILPSFNPTCQ